MANYLVDILSNLKVMYDYEELEDKLCLKKVAIYTRNDERDLQERVCKDFLEENNCNFDSIKVYKDKRNGVDMNSEIIKQLIEDIKQQKINTIICLSVDRIARNIVDLTFMFQLLKQNNVRLLSLH